MGETIRVEHSKDYTVISNLAIRDVRLSFRARGLHHLLLSYPNGWKINIDHLTSESKIEGREAIATALGELEKLGYLTRTQKRVGGKFSGYESVIRELPIKNPPQPKGRRSKKKQESPETAEPETAEPETAEPETAEPETAEPETAEPETANPVHIKYLFNEVINQELSSEKVSIPPNPQTENGEKGEEKSQPVEVEIFESESVLDQICFPAQVKPESLQQTENLPLGQNSAAPLKNGFQQLSGLDPKTGKDYLPWQGMENNRVAIDPKFLEFVAKTLTAKYPFYQNLTVNLLAGEVKKYVRRAEHEDERLAEVWDYWDEYLNPTELPDVTVAQIKSATASEKMIEALRARGYQ